MITGTLNDTDWTALADQKDALQTAQRDLLTRAGQPGAPGALSAVAAQLTDLLGWIDALQDEAANFGYPVVFTPTGTVPQALT